MEHDGSTISANRFQTTSAGKPVKKDALAGAILTFRSFDPTFSRAARLQQRLQPWLAQQMLHTHLFHRICI
jgi:hypothetical protein